MLNELMEYKEYTTSPFTHRLYSKYLIGGNVADIKPLTGINRAMVIVARYFLFNEDGTRDFERAENAVRSWLGKKYVYKDKEIKKIKDWFLEYLRSYKIHGTELAMGDKKVLEEVEKHNNKIDDMVSEIASRRFEDSTFKYAEKAGTDDFNKRTISEVLAEANNAGPLKEWVLIEKEDLFTGANPTVFLKKKNSFRAFEERRLNDVKEMDWIRKLISYYLIERKKTEEYNNQYVFLNKADFYNWANVTTNPKMEYGVSNGGYSDPTDYLFVISSSNSKGWKITIDKRVLDNYEVVPREVAEQYLIEDRNYPYTIYKDAGSKEKLKVMY